MTNRRLLGNGWGWALVAVVAVACSGSEGPAPAQPDGAALFRANCASCHGVDGRGGGPVAADLLKPPADLTRIRASEGWFPEPLVQMIIDGRFSEHGDREMPIWGNVLTIEELRALTGHLKRIQD